MGGCILVNNIDRKFLRKNYSSELAQMKNHFTKNCKTKGNSKIPIIKTNYLIEQEAHCPICGVTFRSGNCNTEHIFPRGIGGDNSNANKIQMCTICNLSRNQVMQSTLGHPPFRKKYAEDTTLTEDFLLWSLSSIDFGIPATKNFPYIQNLFLEIRTGGEHFQNMPTKAYHRLSTWDVGVLPNSPLNHKSKKAKYGTKSKGENKIPKWVSLLNKLFGFNEVEEMERIRRSKEKHISSFSTHPTSINNTQNIDVKPKPETKPKIKLKPKAKPESEPKPNPKTKSNPKAKLESIESIKQDDIEINEKLFISTIQEIIGDEKMSLSRLGRKLSIWQAENGYEETGSKAFLLLCGLKSSSGLLKSIRNIMGTSVNIEGLAPPFMLEMT